MRRTPIRSVSPRRRRENRERALLRSRLVDLRGPWCQVGAAHDCARLAADMHEVLTRARGGSITNPDNILLTCRPCHDWIDDNPAESDARGFTRPSWERDR